MNLDENILDLINDLISEIESKENLCSNCSINDSSSINSYLCDKCSTKRQEDAQKVFKDLESLANEVEQRLQAIENTERELDQWRDQQLEKNRHFWDEYRRQVENFSSSRIGNLQYSYRMKQIQNEKILKRFKRAKYFYENLDQFNNQLNDLIKPELIEFICSEEFQLFLFNFDFNGSLSTTLNLENQFFEQLSNLDFIIFPNEEIQ